MPVLSCEEVQATTTPEPRRPRRPSCPSCGRMIGAELADFGATHCERCIRQRVDATAARPRPQQEMELS